MTHLTASVEFHELAMDYRAASVENAQAAYERLCEFLEGREVAASVPSLKDTFAKAFHYPECWDTAAYPDLSAALVEVYEHYRCTQCAAPQVDAVQAAPELSVAQIYALAEKFAVNQSDPFLWHFTDVVPFAKAIAALASPSPAVPPGWKLVPIEPTDAMVIAPGALHTNGKLARIHRDIWARMLAAAPLTQPTDTIAQSGEVAK